jgi:hypothetical protein
MFTHDHLAAQESNISTKESAIGTIEKKYLSLHTSSAQKVVKLFFMLSIVLLPAR